MYIDSFYFKNFRLQFGEGWPIFALLALKSMDVFAILAICLRLGQEPHTSNVGQEYKLTRPCLDG